MINMSAAQLSSESLSVRTLLIISLLHFSIISMSVFFTMQTLNLLTAFKHQELTDWHQLCLMYIRHNLMRRFALAALLSLAQRGYLTTEKSERLSSLFFV